MCYLCDSLLTTMPRIRQKVFRKQQRMILQRKKQIRKAGRRDRQAKWYQRNQRRAACNSKNKKESSQSSAVAKNDAPSTEYILSMTHNEIDGKLKNVNFKAQKCAFKALNTLSYMSFQFPHRVC